MKKLDKLVLSSFLGPFILTFLVVVFILLTQHMLKYFDDIIGKGLDMDVIGQLLFYFAIFMTPIAMPLAVLLSSLIAFGNLGEHFELTAIKGAGISLLRVLRPIFFFVLVLTGVAFYVNNNLVPSAALEAYSLLYDIKQKKPSLDLREGTFYDGIPDMSIKVNKKYSDGISLKDIIIYDHRKHDGNKDVTIADSGRMYTILNERYLKLELYNGYNFTEGSSSEQEMSGRKGKSGSSETLSRSKFDKTQVVFDLSSFQLSRTEKKWFQGNRIMRNLNELNADVDSLNKEIMNQQLVHYHNQASFFSYFSRQDSVILPKKLYAYKVERDSLAEADRRAAESRDLASDTATTNAHNFVTTMEAKPTESTATNLRARRRLSGLNPEKSEVRDYSLATSRIQPIVDSNGEKDKVILTDVLVQTKVDSIIEFPVLREHYSNAAARARTVKSQLENTVTSINTYIDDRIVYDVQWHKILASSLACIAMFLIGAPLGAIIKRGGLGVPFLVSILFFIIYYLLTMTGEKWAKQQALSIEVGVWAGDAILLIIGLIFLRQARNDARFFEADFYLVLVDKLKTWLASKRSLKPAV